MSVIEPRPDLFTDRFRHYHSSFEQTVSAVIEPRPDLFTVSILGEFSSGKSTLVNALFLEQDLLPTGSGVCTPVPTEIIFGDQMELKIVTPKGTQIYKNDIKSSMEYHCGKEKTDANAFYLTVNNSRLEGMRIIDTPGLNAPNDVHTPLTRKIIDDKISDLVLWTIDLSHGATMSILEMLERLKNADHRCILIANHADKL
jgi:GTPase Era involved in 16S rRNA processing